MEYEEVEEIMDEERELIASFDQKFWILRVRLEKTSTKL
jgi:hypothetical protein